MVSRRLAVAVVFAAVLTAAVSAAAVPVRNQTTVVKLVVDPVAVTARTQWNPYTTTPLVTVVADSVTVCSAIPPVGTTATSTIHPAEAVVQYSLDGSTWTDWYHATTWVQNSDATWSPTSSGPATVPDLFTREGTYYLRAQIVDRAFPGVSGPNCPPDGTVEATTAAVSVPVDFTPPTTTIDTYQMPFETVAGRATLHLTATDSGSGVAYTEFKVDNSAWQRGTKLTLAGSKTALRTYKIYYRSVDRAGNSEAGPAVPWPTGIGTSGNPASYVTAPCGDGSPGAASACNLLGLGWGAAKEAWVLIEPSAPALVRVHGQLATPPLAIPVVTKASFSDSGSSTTPPRDKSLTVTFDGGVASLEPDADIVSYRWTVGNNGPKGNPAKGKLVGTRDTLTLDIAADISAGSKVVWETVKDANGLSSTTGILFAGGEMEMYVQCATVGNGWCANRRLAPDHITGTLLDSFNLSRSTVVGGSRVSGVIQLSDPAPNRLVTDCGRAHGYGACVKLAVAGNHIHFVGPGIVGSSSRSSATVLIPAGDDSARFTVYTRLVTRPVAVTIVASYSGSTARQILTLEPANGYTVVATPANRSVHRGQVARFTLNVHRIGHLSPIAFTLDSWPPGVTGVQFVPNPLSVRRSRLTLVIKTSRATPLRTYPLTITGHGGGYTVSAKVHLTVRR